MRAPLSLADFVEAIECGDNSDYEVEDFFRPHTVDEDIPRLVVERVRW